VEPEPEPVPTTQMGQPGQKQALHHQLELETNDVPEISKYYCQLSYCQYFYRVNCLCLEELHCFKVPRLIHDLDIGTGYIY